MDMTPQEALASLFRHLLQAFTPSLHEPERRAECDHLFETMYKALLDLTPAVHGTHPDGCLSVLCHTCRMRYAAWGENYTIDFLCQPCREAAQQEHALEVQVGIP